MLCICYFPIKLLGQPNAVTNVRTTKELHVQLHYTSQE